MNPASSHRQDRNRGIEEIVLAARRDARDLAPVSEETIGTWVVRQAWLMTSAQIGRGMTTGPAAAWSPLGTQRKERA